MIARDWILDTLAELELWYWPVFLWQLYWLDRYLTARRAEHKSGLIGYSVCRKGRIYITLQAYGDRPDPNEWTKFAPRQPWTKLDPEGRGITLTACLCEALLPVVLVNGVRTTSAPPAPAYPLALKPP